MIFRITENYVIVQNYYSRKEIAGFLDLVRSPEF
jgi:hypothetical protein